MLRVLPAGAEGGAMTYTQRQAVLHCQRHYARSFDGLGYSRAERRTLIERSYGRRHRRGLHRLLIETGALLAALVVAATLGLAGCVGDETALP
jgi:hypothetical protein